MNAAKVIIIMILLFLCARSVPLQAQTTDKKKDTPPIRIIHAEHLYGFKAPCTASDTADTAQCNYQALSGKVYIKKGKVQLFTDSLLINKTGKIIQAFKKVHIIDKDSIHIYAQYMNYNGTEKKLLFQDAVHAVNGKQELFCEELLYTRADSTLRYFTGGKIISDGMNIRSRKATLYTRSDAMLLQEEVRIKDSSFTLDTDSLIYLKKKHQIIFIAPSVLRQDSGIIYTRAGYYNSDSGKAHLLGHPFIFHKKTAYTADTIDYDKKTGWGRARHNFSFYDTANKISLNGHQAIFNTKTQYLQATHHPFLIYDSRKKDSIPKATDSIFVAADTIIHTITTLHALDSTQKAMQDSLKLAKQDKEIMEGGLDNLDAPLPNDTAQPFIFNPNPPSNLKMPYKMSPHRVLVRRFFPPIPYLKLMPRIIPEQENPKENPQENPKENNAKKSEKKSAQKTTLSARKTAPAHARHHHVFKKNNPSLPKEQPIPSIDFPILFTDITEPIDSVHFSTALDKTDSKNSDTTSLISQKSDSLKHPDTSVIKIDSFRKLRQIFAYRNVRIYRDSLQSRADSMAYSDKDSILRTFQNPVLWNEDKVQFSADTIYYHIRNKQLRYMEGKQHSFSIRHLRSSFYDQISSKIVHVFLDSNKVKKSLHVDSVKSLFHVTDEKDPDKLISINDVQSDSLWAYYQQNKPYKVVYLKNVDGTSYPLSDFPSGKKYLPHFKWLADDNIRPHSRHDIIDSNLYPTLYILSLRDFDLLKTKKNGRENIWHTFEEYTLLRQRRRAFLNDTNRRELKTFSALSQTLPLALSRRMYYRMRYFQALSAYYAHSSFQPYRGSLHPKYLFRPASLYGDFLHRSPALLPALPGTQRNPLPLRLPIPPLYRPSQPSVIEIPSPAPKPPPA